MQNTLFFDTIAVRTSKIVNIVTEYVIKSVAYKLHQLFGYPNMFHEQNACGL